MPTSWYQAIPLVMDNIILEQPASILDIGVGFGKYGLLMRDLLEIPKGRYHKGDWTIKIDGVEVFENYKTPLYEYIYDNIYWGNILNLIQSLEKYDIILLIDVIEHFTKEEGMMLIKQLINHCNKAVIVSTPIFPEVQKDYNGNIYEEHKSRWTVVDFSDFDYTFQRIDIGNNGALVLKFFPQKKQISHPEDEFLLSDYQVNKTKPLKISFVLPHKNLTGGLKMLLTQMKSLRKKGHYISAVLKGENGESALPDWFDISVDEEIIVPHNESYLKYIKDDDIIVAGWVGQLKELSNNNIPVFYWEQGHEWLFGDIPDVARVSVIRRYLKENYSQNVYIAAVSTFVSKILSSRYSRNTPVIPNFIDTDFYYPSSNYKPGNTILLVGNPTLRFKGFDIALNALNLLEKAGYRFKLKWVTPVQFQLNNVSFPIEIVIRPSQEELANIYRTSDIFLFTSWYEGFGMPPLEAMASGTPVVATRCGGIDTYAKNQENALIFEPGDVNGLTAGLAFFLKNEKMRQLFGQKGRETALMFNINKGINELEKYLVKVANKT
ncbi:MAG: glycosyltransferase family 4 protein [Thermoanaerobacteraceae bacterium]|nr:glycosyltransferase family 4 protein [Thermoanaerobacteraceae bacterium]